MSDLQRNPLNLCRDNDDVDTLNRLAEASRLQCSLEITLTVPLTQRVVTCFKTKETFLYK